MESEDASSSGQDLALDEPVEPSEAQPEDDGVQPDSQGLIAPYLEDLPESLKGLETEVSEVLERMRKDQDSNVTKRFERTAEELSAYRKLGSPEDLAFAVTYTGASLEDPVATIDWLIRDLEASGKDDIRGEVLTILGGTTDSTTDAGSPSEAPAITQDDIDRRVEQLVNERITAWSSEQDQARQEAEDAKAAEGWIREAFVKLGVTEPTQAELNEAARVANTLIEEGKAGDVNEALSTATKAMVNRWKTFAGAGREPTPQVKAALGGGGTTAPKPDVGKMSDKERQAYMLKRLEELG